MRRFRKTHLNVEDYYRAKALWALADHAHAITLLVGDHNEGIEDGMEWAYNRLLKEAQTLFPIYPHPDCALGHEWCDQNGLPQP